jgi:hypothetical protein
MVTDTFTDLGEVYAEQEDDLKARSAFQVARAFQDYALMEKQAGNNDSKNKSSAAEALADGLAGLGRYELAAQIYEQVAEEAMLNFTIKGRVALKQAALYREHLKDYAKAKEAYELIVMLNDPNSVLEADLKKLVTQDPFALAEGLIGLGGMYTNPKELNKPEKAEELLKRSLEVSGKIPKERGLFEANKALAELARLYSLQGKNAESEKTAKLRIENAGKILSEALDHPFTQNPADISYGEASREYLEANGDLIGFYLAQHREDDAFALYKVMLGDMAKEESNPATCCIRLDNLFDIPTFALYVRMLDDYQQLLLARRMTDEAVKVTAYIETVKSKQSGAKTYRLLLGQ